MPAPADAPARYLVVGANHSSAPLGLRDRMFVDDRAAPEFLSSLLRAGIEQCLVISTCDRVEVVAAHPHPEQTAEILADALARQAETEAPAARAKLYRLVDTEAARHIFAVASSLDSVTVGEPQVLGQLKSAHKLARAAGATGEELDLLLAAAFAAAGRVRTESGIARGPVTLAGAALQVARTIHGDLARASALLVGPGDMAELIVEKLRGAGLARLTVASSSAERATAAARRLNCQGVAFDALALALDMADIVVSGYGAGGYLVTAEMVALALKRRRFRPIFLIDAATPSDIEPSVARIEEAFLYDLEDLEAVAGQALAERKRATSTAWAILDEELARFLAQRAQRAPAATLERLYAHFEAARAQALSRAPADAGEATRLLIRRLLDRPARALRDGGQGLEEAARRLFGLDDGGGQDRRDEGDGKP